MLKKNNILSNPFFLWIAANIVGFGVLGLVVLLFPDWVSQLGRFGSAIIIAIPVSITQWLVLKKIISISWLWIFALPVGLFLAIQIIINIPDGLWTIVDDESILVLTAGYLILGFLIGLPQWLLLRRKFTRASLWIPGTAIALGLGFGLVLVTDFVHQYEVVSYILIVLLYAAITGLILTRWMVDKGSQSASLQEAN